MRGYFSKIARQSGARLANRPAVHTGRASEAPPLPPPMDRHEVVMVGPEPTAATPSIPSRVETKAIPELQKTPPAQSATTEEHVGHFAETIKIVSGREVSKEKASSILVREIHDWIAAGPMEPTARIEEAFPRDHAVVKTETVEVLQRETGVVRISGELVTRREAEPKTESFPKSVEAASIHEQTLELSIGSINVVIEGNPVPTPPQQPAGRPADSANQTSRSPSRLRRNYL